jgi:membrane protease subunit HflC
MSRRVYWWGALIVVIVLAVILYSSVFVVNQTQQALVLRFGQVVSPVGQPPAPVTQPGLYYKLPLIDNVVYFEKRLVDLDSPALEIIANDQKRLVVDAFGRYRIVDSLKFYQTVGNPQVAQQRLSVILNSAVRRVLGDSSFSDLVRDRRAELMGRITQQVDGEAQGLGVDVVDIRIRSADLPAANSQAIYQRMQTERQLVAAQTRAQGDQAGRQIRAEADRQATVIVAEANGESARLRGDGEAQRNQILSGAFSQDPSFFAFYRALQAYQTSFQAGDTRLILSPTSDFFRFFNSPLGTTAPPAAAAAPPAGGTGGAPSPSAGAATTLLPAAPTAPASPAASR